MRNILMRSMAKGENSIRAYKIKRHTADAVVANERGCKIRVARILRFMDNALFDNEYPENSKNRVAQFFIEWAKSSGKFDCAKKNIKGLSRSGIKRFSSPYIHFDYKKEQLELVLPRQYITLREDEQTPEIEWKVSSGEHTQVFHVDTGDSVTGCKTAPLRLPIKSEEIFNGYKFSVIKNATESIRSFYFKEDSVRFFDKDGDMVPPDCVKGDIYALCRESALIQSDAIYDKEKAAGLVLIFLSLHEGDIIFRSDDSLIGVGKAPEEGLLTRGRVDGAYVTWDSGIVPVYSAIPSIYFRMSKEKENGLLIYINGNKHGFVPEMCKRFVDPQNPKGNGYILRLDKSIFSGGQYTVSIDIPNSRKSLEFQFAYIPCFSYEFLNQPYIFQKEGEIRFPQSINISPKGTDITCFNRSFVFPIIAEHDRLLFEITDGSNRIHIEIDIPALQWKFDDEPWNIGKPEEIWHKELPNTIRLKYPAEKAVFSMPPLLTADLSEEGEEQDFTATFEKLRNKTEFVCDTRKMLSWFDNSETEIRPLTLTFGDTQILFAHVITKCIVTGCKVEDDRNRNELIFKLDVIGFADCTADVYYGDTQLAEKAPVTTGGIRLAVPLRSGIYRISVFEWDEDEDEFDFGDDGSDYKLIYENRLRYVNPFDMTGKVLLLTGIVETQTTNMIFLPKKYILSEKFEITNLQDHVDCYYGKHDDIDICIEPIGEITKGEAAISYYDPEEECNCDFLFDKELNSIVLSEDPSLTFSQKKNRYILLSPDEWHFITTVHKEQE